jgi:hypothetical protein
MKEIRIDLYKNFEGSHPPRLQQSSSVLYIHLVSQLHYLRKLFQASLESESSQNVSI